MALKVNKAVFPVAGLGTRFLPATKALPKEMLAIVDKPLIQYAVEEAIRAGITQLIFVTSASKRAIEDHFDTNHELEKILHKHDKLAQLSLIQEIIPEGVSCVYIRQNEPLGLGHAVLCAESVIGQEPFAVVLADDLMDDARGEGCLATMNTYYAEVGRSIVAVERVQPEDVNKYGIVGLADEGEEDLSLMTRIIEKPAVHEAPSHLAVVGRYILNPSIFPLLKTVSPDHVGEIQLTQAIEKLLQQESVFAHLLQGRRYDCGSHLGYLQATIALALQHPKLKQNFRCYLQSLTRELS